MLSPKSYKSITTKIAKSLNYDPFPASQVCPKPKPKNEIYSQFAPKNKDTDLYRKWDCISGF